MTEIAQKTHPAVIEVAFRGQEFKEHFEFY
jgi:hypothetical protein